MFKDNYLRYEIPGATSYAAYGPITDKPATLPKDAKEVPG